MKITKKVSQSINTIFFIGMNVIIMFCENSILKHQILLVLCAIMIIKSTYYVLINRPIKKRDKIIIIILYVFAIIVSIYAVSKII
jgi:hypothetical protein